MSAESMEEQLQAAIGESGRAWAHTFDTDNETYIVNTTLSPEELVGRLATLANIPYDIATRLGVMPQMYAETPLTAVDGETIKISNVAAGTWVLLEYAR